MMIEKVFLHTSQFGRHGSPARDCVRFVFRCAVTLMHYNLVICGSDLCCEAVQFSTSVRYVSLCETGLDKAQPSIRLYELSIPGLGEGIELPSTILNSLQSHT